MKAKTVAIYARVSTDSQTVENQLLELRAVAERNGWVIVEEYTDQGISGAKGRDQRPAFDALIKDAVRRKFDIIATWSVDRLGRSLIDLVGFLGDIHSKGIHLYLHQQGVDTTTPGGKMIFQLAGVFAEFERTMIQERVKAGLKRAKAQGKRLGRPPASGATIQRIGVLRATGMGMLKISRELGIGTSVVQRVVGQGVTEVAA